jgi:hypothetical protein
METAKKFSERVRNPYLTDVQLVWRGVEVEDAVPARTPDLFGGKPLAIHARYARGGSAQLEVRGKIAGRNWSQRVDLDLPKRSSGNEAVGALWARSRIGELERDGYQGMTPAIENEITQLGLDHHLVTKFTSFVAVEEKMTVSDGRPKLVRVPVEMPKGVSWEGVFGNEGNANGPAMQGGVSSLGSQTFVRGGKSNSSESAKVLSIDVQKVMKDRSVTSTREESPATPAPKPKEPKRADVRPGQVTVTISVDKSEIRSGDAITLKVTLENSSGASVMVPEALRLGDGLLRIRVVDSKWNETVIGPPAAGVPMPQQTAMKTLAAGQKRTYTIKLSVTDAAFLRTPGQYHMTVDGGVLGAAKSSNSIVIRVK